MVSQHNIKDNWFHPPQSLANHSAPILAKERPTQKGKKKNSSSYRKHGIRSIVRKRKREPNDIVRRLEIAVAPRTGPRLEKGCTPVPYGDVQPQLARNQLVSEVAGGHRMKTRNIPLQPRTQADNA